MLFLESIPFLLRCTFYFEALFTSGVAVNSLIFIVAGKDGLVAGGTLWCLKVLASVLCRLFVTQAPSSSLSSSCKDKYTEGWGCSDAAVMETK